MRSGFWTGGTVPAATACRAAELIALSVLPRRRLCVHGAGVSCHAGSRSREGAYQFQCRQLGSEFVDIGAGEDQDLVGHAGRIGGERMVERGQGDWKRQDESVTRYQLRMNEKLLICQVAVRVGSCRPLERSDQGLIGPNLPISAALLRTKFHMSLALLPTRPLPSSRPFPATRTQPKPTCPAPPSLNTSASSAAASSASPGPSTSSSPPPSSPARQSPSSRTSARASRPALPRRQPASSAAASTARG